MGWCLTSTRHPFGEILGWEDVSGGVELMVLTRHQTLLTSVSQACFVLLYTFSMFYSSLIFMV